MCIGILVIRSEYGIRRYVLRIVRFNYFVWGSYVSVLSSANHEVTLRSNYPVLRTDDGDVSLCLPTRFQLFKRREIMQ